MADKVTQSVQCGDCHNSLLEDPNILVDDRKPCPFCGSQRRYFSVNIETTITPHTGLFWKHKRPGTKEFLAKGKNEASWSFKFQRWVRRQYTVNKELNLYDETVVDPKTYEVLDECHEPLSSHTNHGSAKNKRL